MCGWTPVGAPRQVREDEEGIAQPEHVSLGQGARLSEGGAVEAGAGAAAEIAHHGPCAVEADLGVAGGHGGIGEGVLEHRLAAPQHDPASRDLPDLGGAVARVRERQEQGGGRRGGRVEGCGVAGRRHVGSSAKWNERMGEPVHAVSE